MAYPFANQSDLESALGGVTKLALLSSKDGVLNVGVVNRALNSGSEDIEQYATKLVGYDWRTNTPAKAVSACIDMAIFHMYRLTHRVAPKEVVDQYNKLIEELKTMGVQNSWSTSTTPAIKTIGRFLYNTPNTPRTLGEVRQPRMSDAGETDWL